MKTLGIKIDHLGRCHLAYIIQHLVEKLGEAEAYNRYRFYFVFENFKCDDYISREVYEVFNVTRHYGLIPVLYGAGNTYKHFLPEGSYINAEDFATVADLAEELKRLRNAPLTELAKFASWQGDYDLNLRNVRTSLRLLCEKLWKVDAGVRKPERKLTTISDISQAIGQCRDVNTEWLNGNVTKTKH